MNDITQALVDNLNKQVLKDNPEPKRIVLSFDQTAEEALKAVKKQLGIGQTHWTDPIKNFWKNIWK